MGTLDVGFFRGKTELLWCLLNRFGQLSQYLQLRSPLTKNQSIKTQTEHLNRAVQYEKSKKTELGFFFLTFTSSHAHYVNAVLHQQQSDFSLNIDIRSQNAE